MTKWVLHATTKKKLPRITENGIKPQLPWESRGFIRAPHKMIPQLIKRGLFKVPMKACIIDPNNRMEVVDSVYNALRAATTHVTGLFGSARTEFRMSKLAILIAPVENARLSNKQEITFWVRAGRGRKTRQYGAKIIEAEIQTNPRVMLEVEFDLAMLPQPNSGYWLKTNRKIANDIADKIIAKIKTLGKNKQFYQRVNHT